MISWCFESVLQRGERKDRKVIDDKERGASGCCGKREKRKEEGEEEEIGSIGINFK